MGSGGEREEGYIGPKQNDADLWITIWELWTDRAVNDRDLEVMHVKAHRTGMEKKAMRKEQTNNGSWKETDRQMKW